MRLAPRPRAQHHPRVPTVNLLSPWVFEALATRRLRRRFGVGVLALVLVTAAGWGVQHLRIGQAEEVLAVEQAETSRLTAETNALTPVRTYVATVDQQKVLVQQAMTHEVHTSAVLAGLDRATPSGVRVETMAVTVTPPAADAAAVAAAPAASPCPGPDPFNTRTVVGCGTLSGSAGSRAAVGDLVVRLGRDALFVEPFISTTTTGEGAGVVFTGSVGLSEKAFSGRYTDMEKLLTQVVAR